MQMIEDGSLNTVEAFASGPISGVPWMTQEVGEEFWDIVNGDYVEEKMVRAASGMGRGAEDAVHRRGAFPDGPPAGAHQRVPRRGDESRRVGAGSLHRGRAHRLCSGRGEDDARPHHGTPSDKTARR